MRGERGRGDQRVRGDQRRSEGDQREMRGDERG